MNSADVVSAFLDYMRSECIVPRNLSVVRASGKLERFEIEGDAPKSKNGWFRLHDDFPPNGVFGNWKTGQEIKWKPDIKPDREWSEAEKQEYRRKIEERRRQEQAEVDAERRKAAQVSQIMWAKNAENSASAHHSYLVRKNVKPHNLRELNGTLLVPVTKNRQIVGLQFISEDGTKRFKFGTDIQGAYYTFGTPKDRLIICEGWATGATLYEATKTPVIVAFQANNLLAVARSMRERLPEAEITIAADNDAWTKKPVDNPGVHYAREAAAAVGGGVKIPRFKKGEPSKPTDYNDLANLYGEDELKHQFEKGSPRWEQHELLKLDGAMDRKVLTDPYKLRYHYPHMRLNKDGDEVSPYSTIENVEELLRRLGVSVRYDIIKKDNNITIENSAFLVDTEKNDKMSFIISGATLANMPVGNVPEFVNYLAAQNPYSPVADWLERNPWDKKSRLSEFFSTVVSTKDSDPSERAFKDTLIRKWMISAIAAAYEPEGISAHGVLVFRGPQNIGKTFWFKKLAPPEMKLVLDGHTLDLKDKDSIYTAVSHWLVELGELDATFRKTDIAQMKSFITKQKDVIRRPYARLESAFARRTVFFGSVNEKDYLHDPTGNRRYWTIDIEAINYNHGLDMQQIWAEILELYRAGESWRLTPEEIEKLNEHNKDFEITNPLEERILTAYEWDRPSLLRPLTASQIAIELGISNPQMKDTKAISKALKDIGKTDPYKSKGIVLHKMPALRGGNSL